MLTSLTVGSVVYEARRPGTFVRSDIAIGAPADEFRLTPAAPSSKTKILSVAVTRIKQKDVVTAGTTLPVRKQALAAINIQLPNDGSYTAAEARSLVTDITAALTEALLTRLASGGK